MACDSKLNESQCKAHVIVEAHLSALSPLQVDSLSRLQWIIIVLDLQLRR